MHISREFALALLTLTNALAFALQGIDKLLAVRGARRLRERSLLLSGLPLAAPGMLLGMHVFRHKTGKLSFLLLAWGVALINAALLAALVWAAREGWLHLDAARTTP
ncbi:MAG: DUF1294 domain-containing protein [Planctomycetes bacterium]|nr:DUF1294 domain-containing protein [Planctomycetota bacterium]